VYFSQITQRHNDQVEFDLSKVTELPRVDILMVYQGAPADLIKAAVDNGAKGIVMATAGAGALSGNQAEGLNYAASKGVFIVTSTRTGSGRIAPPQQGGGNANFQPTPEQLRRRQFTIAGEDHTPIKSRVLLMVALTKTTNREELQRIFSEY
jgi:L-asparaginase